jgi:hypothetical protein
MTAKKTALKRPAAKAAKPAARKAAPAKSIAKGKAKPAAKVAAIKAIQPVAKSKSPDVRATAKPAPQKAAVPAKAAAPIKAAAPAKTVAVKIPAKPIGVIRPIAPPTEKPVGGAAKKAAASRARPAATAAFDPERRRELIAAAAARHRKTAPAKPVAPIAVAPRPQPAIVERHRFSVGDEVRVVSTSGMWFKHGVDYRITAALPPQAGKLQYRIKNEQEPFERVVSESQLASAPAHG